METKECSKCKKVKALNQFQLRSDTGRYRGDCKRCRQDYINEYRRTNDAYKKRYNDYRKERRENDEAYMLRTDYEHEFVRFSLSAGS